jgi:transcriptional regulator with XRE-family HTH domain
MLDSNILKVRAKKIGALMRDARMASGKSLAECAGLIGVSEAEMETFEEGEKSPSLPELEVLAYSLEVPIDHFWGDAALPRDDNGKRVLNSAQLLRLRQRVIGARLRQARLDAGYSPDFISEKTGLDIHQIEAYELGEIGVPVPELEIISEVLGHSVKDFQDRHGPVGVWAAQQRAIQDFLTLSPDLQGFVSKPINKPYLELAQRLSEMSVEKLRAVAEGLLEITL